jgi:hypothetical protein
MRQECLHSDAAEVITSQKDTEMSPKTQCMHLRKGKHLVKEKQASSVIFLKNKMVKHLQNSFLQTMFVLVSATHGCTATQKTNPYRS